MSAAGGISNYARYSYSARSNNLGSIIGTDTLTGLAQTPLAGSYSDSVIVTLRY